jgi:hypothetical protein
MHRKQTSVASQVVPQPSILTFMSRQDINTNLAAALRSSARSSSSSSSSNSSSLRQHSSFPKRDSVVSLDVRRLSPRRSFQSSEAAFVEDDLAEFLAEQPADMTSMGPVYRLVR